MGAETGLRRGRRVVLISESDGLAGLLKHLLGRGRQLTRVATPPEAIERGGLDEADTVILDLPRDGSDTDIVQLRHNYRGPLVVLVDRDYASAGQPADWAWTLLRRPFPAADLAAALGLPGLPGRRPDGATPPGGTDGARIPPVGDPVPPIAERLRPLAERVASQTALATPAAGPPGPGAGRPRPGAGRAVPGAATAREAGAGADPKAAARRAPSFVGPTVAERARDGVGLAVARVLAALTQGWQARRRVRVAGFSALSVVAFAVAFSLAAQDRCGPGCDGLGSAVAPLPTVTAGAPQAPATTAATRARTPATTAPAGADPATGAFRDYAAPDDGALATTTTGRAPATTRRPDPGGGAPPRPTTPTTRPPATTQTTLATTTTAATTTTLTEPPPPPPPPAP